MKSIILIAGATLLAGTAQAQTTGTTTTAPSAATTTTTAAPSTTTAAPAAGATSAALSIKVGASVTDTAGATVGTIKSIDGQFAVLSTGTVEVRLPFASFAAGANGPVIGLTKAQVETAASGANADREAKLASQITAGTTVSDQAGGTVGKIEAVDGEFATVATAKNKVKLPITAFAAGTNGPVIGMTAAQLDAAASAAAPQAAAATTSPTGN